MSRTLGSILTIAGSAALIATGVGAAGGLALFGTTAGISIGGVSTAALLTASTALTAAGTALSAAAGTKAPPPEITKLAIKTERPPRVSAYGRLKLFGAYILYEAASDGSAVDVWAFHDGRVSRIVAWYLGDKLVTRQANGFVLGGPGGEYGNNDTIAIGANLGAATETAHAPVVAKLPGIWTQAHRGDGVVTGYMISRPVKAKDYQQVYPAGGPNNMPLAIVVEAQPVFDWRDPSQSLSDPLTWKWSENAWLHIAHYQLVRNGKTWDRHFAPTLDLWTAAVNDADSPVPLRGGTQVTIGANAGASTIQVANAGEFAVGGPITVSSQGAAPQTRTVTAITGVTIDVTPAFSSIVPTGARARGPGGTEPRYRSCVAHRNAGEGSEPKAVLGALLACCDGWMASREDEALVPYSGRYYEPTVTLGPDEIISYTVEDGIEDEAALNNINVTYVSAEHDYNEVDTNPWTDEDDITRRGALRSADLKNQVPSHAQARRLAKRKMAQTMAPKRGTVSLMSSGSAVLSQRFINLRLIEGEGTEDEFAPYIGPAEITDVRRNLQTGGLSASWIAADPNIDAWNPATEEGEPAPVGERVAREPLEQPTIVSASAVYSAVGQTPEGEQPVDPAPGQTATGARILIAADGPDRTDLTWYARWRVGTSGSWNEREYADADPGPAVSFTTEFVPLANNVNVEVAYSVGDGRLSPWSDPAVVDTTGG
ncbi:MAG: hypothetical protein PGN16_04145 [Sphingomonas phyllosphaerae]|uniref:hypothetical protein n=1 Tax=Sphingomonas phyllosphaerae TaxID=257003 RepID=UPI002FF972BC